MDLKSIDLFRDFEREEIEKFIPIISRIEMRSGEVLFNEGDPGDALYIIYEGAIRISKTIDRDAGTEKSLALLSAGTYLGEMTLLEGASRSASARAEVDSVVLKLSREDFIRLLHNFHRPPSGCSFLS